MNTETITAVAKAPAITPLKATTSALNVSDAFLADFCATIDRKNCITEVAKNFRKADHHTNGFTAKDYKAYISQKQSFGIMGSITPRHFPEDTRCGAGDVVTRNYVAFDFDVLKSLNGDDTSWKQWSGDRKLATIKEVVEPKFDAIFAAGLGEPWFINFTGHGFHVWYRTTGIIKIDSEEQWKNFYHLCGNKLKTAIGLDYDEQTQGVANLMRLPCSWNIKKDTAPVLGTILRHNPQAYSTNELRELWVESVMAMDVLADEARVKKDRSNVVNISTKKSGYDEDAERDYLERLKRTVTWDAVLTYCGYSGKTPQPKGDWLRVQSAWTRDSDPSCYLNTKTMRFHDFSSGKWGSALDYIMECKSMTLPEAKKVLMELTGLPAPEKRKKTPQPTAVTATEEPIQARASLADFSRFFSQNLPDLSVCSLTGYYGFKDKGKWERVGRNELKWLRAMAKEQGLCKNDVDDYLALHARSLNKRLLVDLPDWDGVDRIKDICSRVKLKNMSSDHLETLMKGWGATMIARLGDPYIQNVVPIFRGNQGDGKDVFIRYMTNGLGRYYNSCKIGIPGKEIEDYRYMYDSVAIHIEEMKMKSICPNHFKELITKSSATWRKHHDDGVTKHWFHSSFIASTNDPEVLTDFTGNRRFWIFELAEKFPAKDYWHYPVEETSQIIAQYFWLHSNGYKAEQEALADMTAYVKSATPKSPTELILEAFDNEMHDWETASAGLKVRSGGAQEMFAQIARFVGGGITAMKVAKVLAENGRSRKGAGNRPEYFRLENRPNG